MLNQFNLPGSLRERCRVAPGSLIGEKTDLEGDYVLYWMRSAVRAEENPALDVARLVAEQLELPLLVYHAISQHYEYASDRHHRFMLEGARDVQKQFREIGIPYAFHLATPVDQQPHLVNLAQQAAMVITEDMPVDPPRRFLRRLVDRSSTPTLCVDTACVVPMQLVGRAYTRAFQFRRATQRQYDDRLTQTWPKVEARSRAFDIGNLPFEPLDLQVANLSHLIAECDIDHSVGPVWDTVGGSQAGYARWNLFKESGLKRYAKLRNNALVDGVSRMSAYLHYGMVSPFRIARETASLQNGGAEKFLDELLIWRELAYAFCFYRADHDQWTALPQWAQDTLNDHAHDRRETTYSWEQLARGKTGEPLWNAAQKSLLMQGELHNNVRMTWGKAILKWTDSPQTALALMVDLNHRYALDGRDPASYGGILWCVGQFDRPFEPPQKINGTVRSRSTAQHASRLCPDEYLRKVVEPRFHPVPKVAVIGAGISGLFAARTLQDHGVKVTVFEKSRGVGGRMSTRRVDDEFSFDHGAQYFTARDRTFRRYVKAWCQSGLVESWPSLGLGREQNIVVIEDGVIQSKSESQERFVGAPAMNSIGKHLAVDLDVHLQSRVDVVRANAQQLDLLDDQGQSLGSFDQVVVAIPAEQAGHVLREFDSIARPLSQIEMKPCWALMTAFEEPVTGDWVGAFLHDSFLSWASRNGTKPGRNAKEQLVVHATPDWTLENWEADPELVAEQMLDEFWRVSGCPSQSALHRKVHRWKYAIPYQVADARCYADQTERVFACGDWAVGSRVEGAFLSGMATAGRILGTLSVVPTKNSSQTMLF